MRDAARLPPTPPPAPKPEDTHAGPAPKKGRKRGPKKPPWVARAEAEQAARAGGNEFIDQIIAMALDPKGLEELLKLTRAEHAKASFAEFFRQAWKIVEPSTDLVWNWHLDIMAGVLQAVFFDWLRAKREKGYINKIRNVIFNVPPGSSKSKLIAVCFQAWCWLHWPGMKFLCLSVNDDATMRDARAMRDLVRSPWYVDTFKVAWSIKGDQDAISNFGNSEGGDRISMPIKSEIIGLRADLICIDDPNNPKKSESKKERDEVNELWDTNQYNRVNDLARSLRVGVQQRTNAADWTGHVIDLQGAWSEDNQNGWLHVVLPAEFEAARKFVMPAHLADILRAQMPAEDLVLEDPRTVEGETIDAVRMPKSVLDGERERWRGTGNFAGQMQQRPALAEGLKVQRPWWNFFRLAAGVREDIDDIETGRPRPAHCHTGPSQVIHGDFFNPEKWDFDWICISLDPASKKTTKGSNWGLLVIAGKGGRRYVLDDRTQRGALHEIMAIVRDLILTWHPDTILIEPKAAGPDVMDTLLQEMGRGDLPMVTIEEAEPGNDDKEIRLEAALPYIKNGMVYLLDGAPWLEDFVEELSLFPNGLRDDRVDALSQCLNWKRESEDVDWPSYA